ncbi:MAG: ComEC/Rec2 family competence protein [Chloroflexi bacterium]|nr:ComEC/Rec2 family competence protein [Chloroflexota bacterium]
MPLLWLSLAFLAGIILAANLTLPAATWLILAGASLLVTIVPRLLKASHISRLMHIIPMLLRDRVSRLTSPVPSLPIGILFAVLFMGGFRFQASLPNLSDPTFIAAYNNTEQRMAVTGVITALPDERDTYTNLRVETESIHPIDEVTHAEVHGLMLAKIPPGEDFHYGDRIVITGYLETPPDPSDPADFSYREYLARQGVYSYIPQASAALLETGQGSRFMTAIYALKEKALSVTYRLWPDPEASLFAGILLGVETGIPEPVVQDFKNTGTSHVIAISGFNITIVAGLFATFFGRFLGPQKGAVAAVIGIAIYTLLVGADPAVVRAAIMGGFALFARQVGRRQHGLNALAFTAAIMALANPHVPWDVGFQLSFAATLGLVLYADPMAQWFTRLASRRLPEKAAKNLAGPVGEYFLFTIAAQITTLPIMAYHFGRISLVAFVANPVILPIQPPIMTLGGLAVILGLIWFPLGKLAALLAWPFVLFTIRSVEFFGKFTGGVLILGAFGILWVILFYGVLLTWTLAGSRFRKLTAGLKPVPLIAALGIAAVVTWRADFAAPDNLLHLTLLDVGTGDALLIQTPAGRYILIDGGPSTSLLSNGLGRRLPPFHRQLDWLVVASPRSEDIAALPRVLERFPPSNALWGGPESPARVADYLRETLTSLQIPVTLAEAGQSLDLGDGASLRVLTSGKRGLILLLEWDSFRALLPLGASDEDLESLRLGRDVGQVTVLLLADNGYAPTNPPEWIAELSPQLVLLSVAPDDRDGLPARETLDALGGYSLLRTDQHGWIRIDTDGDQLWVEVEK